MEEKKYILTISILASNRKDTFPKTLASIKPILDNVSCELIVTDTGCDNELLTLIKQYTDKIVKFDWCKDFAKARNVGLELAQGQWFMYLDDDEWFEDVSEIIQFFNSSEKDRYGYGKYVQRNYHTLEGRSWSDFRAGRLFKLNEGTKFVDKIHERPINVSGPEKNFDSYVHHYGYVFKDEGEMQAHCKRNSELLWEIIKKEPQIARHYVHLWNEYSMMLQFEDASDIAYKGISNADMCEKDNKKDVSTLYAMHVWALLTQHRYSEVCEHGVKYLASPICSDLCKLAIYSYMAVATYMDKDYYKALEYAELYFRYMRFFDINPELKKQQSASLILDADSLDNITRVAAVAFAAASCVGDEELLERYIKYLDFTIPFGLPEPCQCMENIVKMMCNSFRLVKMSFVANNILKSNQYKKVFFDVLMKLEVENRQKFNKLADIVAMTDSDDVYVDYIRIISARDDMYTERMPQYYTRVIKSDYNVLWFDNRFWNIAYKKNIDIDSILQQVALNEWIKKTDMWIENAKVQDIVEKDSLFSVLLSRDSMHKQYMDAAISEAMLIRRRLDGITREKLQEALESYSCTVVEYYKSIYKEAVFDIYTTILPIKCQVALMVSVICRKKALNVDIKHDKEQILKLMPKFKRILDKYEEIV